MLGDAESESLVELVIEFEVERLKLIELLGDTEADLVRGMLLAACAIGSVIKKTNSNAHRSFAASLMKNLQGSATSAFLRCKHDGYARRDMRCAYFCVRASVCVCVSVSVFVCVFIRCRVSRRLALF